MTKNTMRTRTAVRGPAAVLTALFALAGCGADVVEVTAPPATDPRAYPVVSAGQAGSVLGAVDAALVRGVGAKDTAKTVDARLVGPFRELALAQARIAAERKKKVPAPEAVTQVRLIVPSSRTWPRFFVAAGTSAEAPTPLLRVLTSADPRSPYGLWAEADMLPGATLPETAPPAVGAEMLPAGAPGLAATPEQVLGGFAAYLDAGAKATATRPFRRSAFSDEVVRQLAADRKELKQVATVSSRHTVVGDPFAVRTKDGGALVVGRFEHRRVITVKKGKGTVKFADPALAALAGGKKQFKKKITRTAVEVVVFAVPPSGKGRITPIAAQKGDVKAVAT